MEQLDHEAEGIDREAASLRRTHDPQGRGVVGRPAVVGPPRQQLHHGQRRIGVMGEAPLIDEGLHDPALVPEEVAAGADLAGNEGNEVHDLFVHPILPR